MYRFVIVLLTFLLLVSCSAAPVAAQDVQARKLVSNTQMVTTSESSTPAVDNQATAEAWRLQAISDHEARIAAEQAQIDTKATEQALEATVVSLTATLQADQNAAAIQQQTIKATSDAFIIAATATGQVVAKQQTEANTKLLSAQAENARAQMEAKTAVHKVVLSYLTIGLIILIILILIIYAVRQSRNEWDDIEPEAIPEPAPIAAYPIGLDMRLFQNVATPDQLRTIAEGIQVGKALTHANWTPREKLLSEGQFTSLQYILCKYGRATWADAARHENGIVLTPEGNKFFQHLLETTSPLKEDAYQPLPRPINRQIDSPSAPIQ